MTNENRENQIYELEALESVLRENKLTRTSDWEDSNAEIRGIVEVGFDLITDPKVTIVGVLESGENFSVPLDILPPIRLKFHFPDVYPSNSSPQLEIESDWMTMEQKTECEAEMAQICEENEAMPVLFFCYQSIIDKMDQNPPKVIRLNDAYTLKNGQESILSLKKKILGKGEEAATEHFVNKLFDCEVCYDSLLGQHCIKFQPCGHVFCKNCTQDFYRSEAKGLVSKPMQCLAEGCSSEAEQGVVKEALGEELFAKYETEMLTKAIREMDDTVECPREYCKKVAYVTDQSRNLAECSYCNFSFCNACKQTFHGVSSCKWKNDEKAAILKSWQEGGAAERAQLCRQFGGEKNVVVLVERFLNEVWLDENSKPCPKCAVSIEKNEGCNKLHCAKCDTFFCWLCSAVLSKDDPYKHFQDGVCSGRLFEGVHHFSDDDEDDVGHLPDLDLDDAFDEGSEDDEDFDELLWDIEEDELDDFD
uniref:RBR-type E3 ubiquitin transferase n=1 Tax=Caenorhabditis japonica TaxID=281687 RepID=A0A8R1DZM6_CAEJA